MSKPSILFLCTGNSCRSQMAEGLTRALKGDVVDVYSAGIEKHGLNPLAVKALAEQDIDITSHTSKTLDDLGDTQFHYVITVCGHAHETCPFFPASKKVVHHGFDDPPFLAKDAASDDEALPHYRRVRDEIREFVMTLPESIQ